MNLKKNRTTILGTLGFAVFLNFASVEVCQASTCDDADGAGACPYVCVSFPGGDPEEDTDFTFDFTTCDEPVIKLKTPSPAWIVWSQVSSGDTDEAPIGTIMLDYAGSGDFEVKIANGANPGASNLASIVLTDGVGFTGHSSIEASKISGNLTDDVTVQRSGGNGGDIELEVGGFSGGDITAYSVTLLKVGGYLGGSLTVTDAITHLDVTGNLSGTVGGKSQRADIVELDVAANLTGDLWVDVLTGGDILGDITATGSVNATTISNHLNIGGDVITPASVIATTIVAADIDGDVSGTVTVTNLTDLAIGGDLVKTGTITITTLTGDLLIGNDPVTPGDCNGEVYVTTKMDGAGSLIRVYGDVSASANDYGLIDVEEIVSGAIDIDGSVGVGELGKIDVVTLTSASVNIDLALGYLDAANVDLGTMSASTLTVGSAVGTDAVITIGSMASTSSLAFNTSTGDFAGDLKLEGGLPASQTVTINGALTPTTASIDFYNYSVAGTVTVKEGGAGILLRGGAVTGTVELAHENTTFSGTATFSAVNSGGFVGTEINDVSNTAILDGTINVTGALAGDVSVGHLEENGEISVGSVSITGDILSEDDAEGDIAVTNALVGDVTVGALTSTGEISVGSISNGGEIISEDDVYGDIEVTNAAMGANSKIHVKGSLSGAAEIMIGGLCDIPIWINDETAVLTLIDFNGGLDDDCELIINRDERANDAEGRIKIGNEFLWCGPSVPPPMDFDGSIMIRTDGSGSGDLEGSITFWGCDDEPDDFDICICGGDGAENITLNQHTCSGVCLNAADPTCYGDCE